MKRRHRYKPGVSRRTLLFLAGLMWIVVGATLLTLAARWLRAAHPAHLFALIAGGVAAALLIHHFGFLRIVDKNLDRILPMEGKRCVFSFLSWRSYLLVAFMMTLGFTVRHSAFPKTVLAVIYTGIGLALILSSVRYLRVLLFDPAAKDG